MASHDKPGKATQIRVGLPSRALRRVQQIAQAEGISISATIRRAVLRDLRRAEADDPKPR